MNYELSQHAEDVIEARKIEPEWLDYVLTSPLKTEPDALDADLEHRLGIIKEYENRVLRVIINTNVQPIRVVTAYFDRKMKGEL